MNEDRLSGHLERKIDSGHGLPNVAVKTRVFGGNGACGFALERATEHQIPVGERLSCGGRNDTVLHLQRVNRERPFFSRQGQQNMTHLGAGVLNGCGAIGHGKGTGRHPLIGHQARIARGDANPRDVHIQLLGTHLANRGEHALAQFHLAHQQRDGLIGVDSEPCAQCAIRLQVPWQTHRLVGTGRERLLPRQKKRELQREITCGFEKTAAIERGKTRQSGMGWI